MGLRAKVKPAGQWGANSDVKSKVLWQASVTEVKMERRLGSQEYEAGSREIQTGWVWNSQGNQDISMTRARGTAEDLSARKESRRTEQVYLNTPSYAMLCLQVCFWACAEAWTRLCTEHKHIFFFFTGNKYGECCFKYHNLLIITSVWSETSWRWAVGCSYVS